MRHRVKTKKLNRSSAHRKALLKNLMRSLILGESIVTTTAKAKETKRFAQKLISIAKKDDTHSRREVFKALGDKKIVKKFFDEVVPRLEGESGGDVRVLRMGKRKGDGADISLIEFIFPEKKIEKKEKKKRGRPSLLSRRKKSSSKKKKDSKEKKKSKKKTKKKKEKKT